MSNISRYTGESMFVMRDELPIIEFYIRFGYLPSKYIYLNDSTPLSMVEIYVGGEIVQLDTVYIQFVAWNPRHPLQDVRVTQMFIEVMVDRTPKHDWVVYEV